MAIDPITGHVKARILVVEDDGDLLSMIKSMLQSLGEVTLANDGQEAIELLRHGFKPDVIVTDVMMPRMDGVTLAKTLKKHADWQVIPVVMLTAKSGPLDMVTGINAGARHYVTKPFKASELVDKVKKALQHRRATA